MWPPEPVSYTGEQVCEGIKEALGTDRFQLSHATTLESCLMALDLDTPSMDRGAIQVDGMGIWEWRDSLLSNLPQASCNVDRLAADIGCVVVGWMCGHYLAQDSVLCVVPLIKPDDNAGLRAVARAFWFIINRVGEIVGTTGFSKDEQAISRYFYGVKWTQSVPVLTGIEWLDELQCYFDRKLYLDPLSSIPLVESIRLESTSFNRLVEPLLSNTYGIGCPRAPVLSPSPAVANEHLNRIESEFKYLCYAQTALKAPVLSLEEAARLLSPLSSCTQLVRACATNVLFATVFSPESSFWMRVGGIASHTEFRGASDAFHVLLHAPARIHRLIPDWLKTYNTEYKCGSKTFEGLVLFMKVHWVELLESLDLLSEDELEVARMWREYLLGTLNACKPACSVRRWKPLLN